MLQYIETIGYIEPSYVIYKVIYWKFFKFLVFRFTKYELFNYIFGSKHKKS